MVEDDAEIIFEHENLFLILANVLFVSENKNVEINTASTDSEQSINDKLNDLFLLT